MPKPDQTDTKTELKIEGEGNVAAAGDIIGGTIVTGDGNTITVNHGASTEEIIDKLRTGGLLPRLTTVLPESTFKQLLGLLAGIKLSNDDLWFRLYRACLPASANLINSTIPALLLTDLCLHPLIESWPPIFEFVERLVLNLEADATASILHAWVDANANHVTPPVLPSEIGRLRKRICAEQKQNKPADNLSYLQIYLEPALLNRTQERKQPLFNIELVLESAKTAGPLVLQSGNEQDKLWTLDELPELLDAAFANPEYVSLIPDITQLTIEIVAPSATISYGFERWKHNRDEIETYGLRYPLVVRLQDRHTIPNAADQARADIYWQQKWKFFCEEMSEQTIEQFSWLAKKELENCKITKIQLQKKADVPCLGIGLPLLAEKPDVFDLIGHAGIPIALWLRGGVTEIDAIANVSDLVTPPVQGKTLAHLRNTLQEIRSSVEALTDEKNFANFLTLLWDDPTRPPYKYDQQGVFV